MCWRGILGGVRDYLGEVFGDFWRTHEGEIEENYIRGKNENITNPQLSHLIVLDCLFSDQGVLSQKGVYRAL